MQTVNDDAPTHDKQVVLKHLKRRTKKIGKRNKRSISHILLASGSKDGNYLSEINDTVNINEGVAMDKVVSVELKPKEGYITTRSGRKTKAPIWMNDYQKNTAKKCQGSVEPQTSATKKMPNVVHKKKTGKKMLHGKQCNTKEQKRTQDWEQRMNEVSMNSTVHVYAY